MHPRRIRRALLICVFAGTALPGQVIRGRVVQRDGTPVDDAAVMVVANDSTLASARSTLLGVYQLRVTATGRYDVRVTHIGFRPASHSIQVDADLVHAPDIIVEPIARAIPGMEIRDRGECNVGEREAERLMQLWRQARATVGTPRPENRPATFEARILETRGRVDATRFYAPDTIGSGTVTFDSLQGRESITETLIGRTPAETLDVAGYIRPGARGGIIHDIPGPAALVSDVFLAGHCLRATDASSSHPDWVGVAFTPRTTRENVVEIAGIVWFDRSSGEPRRIEFDYTNVAPRRYELCRRDAPSLDDRTCIDLEESGTNKFGIGGDAEFRRMPNGQIVPIGWSIRSVSADMRLHAARRGVRFLAPKETCSEKPKVGVPRRGDCVNPLWPVPILDVASITVVEAWRDGTRIYVDSGALRTIGETSQKQSGVRYAHVEGTLTDTVGRPLRNAIVTVDSLGRVARTDSLGGFRIQQLPPGSMALVIRCRGYRSVRLTISMLPDSSRRLSGALRPDSLVTNRGTDCAKWQ